MISFSFIENPPLTYNINYKDEYGDTALICATLNNYTEIVKYLIKNGADISIKNKNNYKASDFNNKTKKEKYINLHKSLYEKSIKISNKVNLLIKNFTSEHKNMSLIIASKNNRLDIVEYLISFSSIKNPTVKYNINYKDKDGKTALIWAVEKRRSEIVKYYR